MIEPSISPDGRKNYLITLAESQKNAQRALAEAKNQVAFLNGEQQMETVFQDGLALYQKYGEKKDIEIIFKDKPAQLNITDVYNGGSFQAGDNIRFIVSDVDKYNTFLADVSLERKPDKSWTAHEVEDVHLDSWKGGHGSRSTAVRASGITDEAGVMRGDNGLSDNLLAVITSVKTLVDQPVTV